MLRSLIYVAFIVAAALGLYLKKRKKPVVRPQVSEEALSPVEMLRSTQWQLRLAAVQGISDEPDTDILSHLVTLLEDTDYDVRTAAVEALGRYGESQVDPVLSVLERGRLDARIAAAQVLERIAPAAAVPRLIETLHSDDSVWVRIPVVRALGKFGEDHVVTALSEALSDTQSDVVSAAQEALKQIATPSALAALAQNRSTNKQPQEDKKWTSDLLSY